MPVYRPKELTEFLKAHSFKPLSRFSQNFLVDGNVVRKIADLVEIEKGELVIEIGPGPGALTEELLLRGARVIAIEMDRGFAENLPRFGSLGPLEVLEQDALIVDIGKIIQDNPKQKIKIVGNLPYHITTPLLTKLLPLHAHIASYTFMVQKEFARRMIAEAGSDNFSSFSVFVSLFAKPTSFFDVKSASFFPKPKVDSTVLHLVGLPKTYEKPDRIITLCRTAFNQRRKKLTSSLTKLFSKERIENSLLQCGFSLDTRPEDLNLEAWIKLSEQFFLDDKQYAKAYQG